MTAKRIRITRSPGDIRQTAGQNYFEQAEEITGEERQDQCHRNQKDRLLELYPPADRDPGRSNGNQTTSDQQKRKNNPGGRGDKSTAHVRRILPAMANNTEQLQREHRQNAGH